jgi:hypothetical protein
LKIKWLLKNILSKNKKKVMLILVLLTSHSRPIRFILDVGCGDGCSHPQPHPHPFIQNIRNNQNNFGCQNDLK